MNEKRARELFEEFKEQSSPFAVLLVPGLWGHHYPGYYVTVRDMFRSIDIECEISRVNSEGSVKENARTVKDEIEELCENKNNSDKNEKRRKRVLAMGHSKGGLDIARRWRCLKRSWKTNSRDSCAFSRLTGGHQLLKIC